MAKHTVGAQERAEASFKRRAAQVNEGSKVKAEHDASIVARDANTAQLKSLRLEKEQAARDAASAVRRQRLQRGDPELQ